MVLGSNGTLDMELASSQPSNDLGNYKTVNYYARFNCGTISDDSGPLRPGKYDSDITIFNKKSYPITVIWKAIEINQQERTNFNILNIPSENIVNINCAKIFPIQDKNATNSIPALSKKFTEGIIKLEISVDNGLLVNNFLNNQQANIILNESEIGNLINVDVLHTVNTLDDLNKEVVYLKADFSILPKDNNKISNFTVVFHINPDEIVDPLSMIKKKISENNTTEKIDINTSEISLRDTEIISDTLTDNHALTVQRVDPIIS
ncbi:MAG: hypothetical protein L0H53_12745 [Candidatus Nitrosocosmicus sp.]|nr:hypothetical protein [Candidatus Nitrosocosmicus sp.]